MLRVVIVDDEPLALELLQALFDDVPGVRVVGRAGAADDALRLARELDPDLVVLDVEMPGGSGLQAAVALRGARPQVVFVTAHDRFAVDAFEVDAADYLLKPVRLARVSQAVERVRARLAAATPAPAEPPAGAEFWASTRTGLTRVPERAIRWIEAQKDHVLLHTPERAYLVRTTMAGVATRLTDPDLQRVHRSAFVRMSAVTAVRRSRRALSLTLEGGRTVAVGPSYAEGVKRRLGFLERAMDGASATPRES